MFGLRFSQVGIVEGWLAQGATPAIVRQVAKAFNEMPNRSVITSIRYLERDVLAQAEASAPMPAGSAADIAYLADVKAWTDGGCLGPAPVRNQAA